MDRLEALDDAAENVGDCRAKDGENDNNHNSDQYEDQSVFNETLTFFTGHVHHKVVFLLPCEFMGNFIMTFCSKASKNQQSLYFCLNFHLNGHLFFLNVFSGLLQKLQPLRLSGLA